MHFVTLISLSCYFLLMLGIGVYAYKKSTSDMGGYVLGGRNVSAKVTALSAGASDMSGWMLMGLPGAMFVSGYDTVLVAFGLLVGAILNYQFIAPRLRVFTEKADDALTLPDFFGKRFFPRSNALRILTALVTIVFFTVYTASGLVAGGKLFESAFGLDYKLGLFLTAATVVLYTVLGGFLAVSMTDFVQGCIMFVALLLVPIVAMQSVGSIDELVVHTVPSIGVPADLFTSLTVFGVLSSLSWGLGYFGQPHIIVRFMAIASIKEVPAAKRIGISWMTVTLIGALGTGLTGLAYTQKLGIPIDDPETIFIYFSQILFHPAISGFLLAAILAAIMSTISSQLLVSSSSLTEDIYRLCVKKTIDEKRLVTIGRVFTIIVAAVACAIALGKNQSVLALVAHAWAGFGASFGPLVLFSLYWKHLTPIASVCGVIAGALTVIMWAYFPIGNNGVTLSTYLYEMVPGVVVSSLVIVLVGLLNQKKSDNNLNQQNFSALLTHHQNKLKELS